jgi:hypothetical protein
MPEPDSTTSVDFINKVNIIKTILNLTIHQLSELFNVSPKIIYDWYDGIIQPNILMEQRIEILIDVLNQLPSNTNPRRLKSIWKIPVSNKSFLKVFTTEHIDVLYEKLTEKLTEMNFWLSVSVPTKPIEITCKSFLGNAHLAEYDRIMTFN